jgi:hypothetical protein
MRVKTIIYPLILVLLVLESTCFGDIRGTSGQINFDAQNDGQAEMTLDSTGLGIGGVASANLDVSGNMIVSDQMFIGQHHGSSNLNIHGTMSYNYQTISSNSLLADHSMIFVNSYSGNVTLTLPYAANVTGRIYRIKKISSENSVWITGAGNLIDDTNPIELKGSITDLPSVEMVSDGHQWYVIASKNSLATVASDNLIAWWKLDEVNGNISRDSSTNSSDGTITNLLASNIGVNGKTNHALEFDGSGNHVDFDDSNFPSGSQPHTVSFWFYKKGVGFNGWNPIIAWGNNSTNKIRFMFYLNP